jgi:hypothetical protein
MHRQFGTRKSLVIVAAVVGAAIAVACPAGAWSAVGGYSAGYGYCWANENGGNGDRILASAPIISPAGTNSITGGGQLVGYFVTLQRWNGSAWVMSQVSTLYTKTASWGFDDGSWYNGETHSWDNGWAHFPIKLHGYAYRLGYDYFWFDSNERITGHAASLSWGLRDDRYGSLTTTTWRYVDWCVY